jgi:hypothetical protein
VAYKKTRFTQSFTAKTATFNGNPIRVDQGDYLTQTVTTTNKSGTTPTLDVKLQQSPDDGTTWVDVASATIAQISDANTSKAGTSGPPVAKYLRPVFTIGGTTPSFDIAYTLEAHRLGRP